MKDLKVIIASNSPRRRELLSRIFGNIAIAQSRNVDESYPSTLPASEVAAHISRKKAEAYADLVDGEGCVLITADTVVVNDGRILGKPTDRDNAIAMLKSLSGHTHQVYTGYTITTSTGMHTYTECTDVTFTALTDSETAYYVDTYHPYDKAGSYGIQEWIGEIAVKSIHGDFYNVMGLPVCALYHHLLDLTQ